MSRALAALLATALALGACNGGSGKGDATPSGGTSATSSTPGATTAVSSPAPSTATSGERVVALCSPERPHAGGDTTETIDVGGTLRSYILHVPPSYRGDGPAPLILNFHGFGSNARQQAIYSQLPAKADARGVIAVTPDGLGSPQAWNLLPTADNRDVAFVRALLDDLQARLCVDGKAVFAAGISNGAAFSARLACDMPERLRGIAVVGAFVFPRVCPSTTPTAVIGFHGTEDPCVPYGGGTSKCGMMLPVPPVEEALTNWARHDACQHEPSRTQISEHVRATAYSQCDAETAVVLYTIEGGGHTWPGSVEVARLGATTQEINAADAILEFFAGQTALAR